MCRYANVNTHTRAHTHTHMHTHTKKEQTVAVAFNLEDTYNSPVQTADGPAHAKWSLPNIDLVDCRSAHGKNNGCAAWKLELCSLSAPKVMPAVTFEGAVVKQTNHLRYHLINFDRMLRYRQDAKTQH